MLINLNQRKINIKLTEIKKITATCTSAWHIHDFYKVINLYLCSKHFHLFRDSFKSVFSVRTHLDKSHNPCIIIYQKAHCLTHCIQPEIRPYFSNFHTLSLINATTVKLCTLFIWPCLEEFYLTRKMQIHKNTWGA